MRSGGGAWSLAVRAIPYLAFLALVYTVFPITTDDSYITLRYASNLLAGHGAVFNVGERVEGYSSPLHMLLLAGMLRVAPSLDALFLAKLLSLAFGILVLWQAGVLARRAGLSAQQAMVAQCLVALNVDFAIAAVNGLETTLYALLVALCAGRFLAECEGEGGYWSAILAVLMLLTRPDAMLLVGALLFLRLFVGKRKNLPVGFWGRWWAVVATGALALFLWRYVYYGSLLPNTYYAKQVPISGTLSLGLRYYLRGLSATTLILSSAKAEPLKYLCVLVFWTLTAVGLVDRRKTMVGALMVALLLASLVFMLRSGGDWMLGWRFMIPMLPFLAILQLFGALRMSRSAGVGYAVALSVTALALVNAPRFTWGAAGFATDGRALLSAHGGDEWGRNGRLWVAAGDAIRALLPAGSKVAYSEMGYAGWVNRDKILLDMRGLTNARIAHSADTHRTIEGIQDTEWFLPTSAIAPILSELNPDAILSNTPTHSTKVLERWELSGSVEGIEIYLRAGK